MAAANPIPAQADDHRQRAALEYRLLNATVLTIPHAGAGANQTRDYVQTNPLNQDLHCLWHVFARGYYGNSPASHRRYDYIRQRVGMLCSCSYAPNVNILILVASYSLGPCRAF